MEAKDSQASTGHPPEDGRGPDKAGGRQDRPASDWRPAALEGALRTLQISVGLFFLALLVGNLLLLQPALERKGLWAQLALPATLLASSALALQVFRLAAWVASASQLLRALQEDSPDSTRKALQTSLSRIHGGRAALVGSLSLLAGLGLQFLPFGGLQPTAMLVFAGIGLGLLTACALCSVLFRALGAMLLEAAAHTLRCRGAAVPELQVQAHWSLGLHLAIVLAIGGLSLAAAVPFALLALEQLWTLPIDLAQFTWLAGSALLIAVISIFGAWFLYRLGAVLSDVRDHARVAALAAAGRPDYSVVRPKVEALVMLGRVLGVALNYGSVAAFLGCAVLGVAFKHFPFMLAALACVPVGYMVSELGTAAQQWAAALHAFTFRLDALRTEKELGTDPAPPR